MISITISAVLPQLRPPPCPTQENCKEASSKQLWVLYASLLLTSIGVGGIKPCVITFAADQFDMSKSETAKRGWNLFNWYYFSMTLASLLALTFVVYIQDNVGWGWGLGVPTIVMGLSIIAFVTGAPLYKRVKPGGSPLVRLAQVVVAAVKKRNVVAPNDHGLLYENKVLDANISYNGSLLHSNQFRWLDRAAVVKEGDLDKLNQPISPWRLSTTHRVEELKSIIRVLPIWAAGILLVTSYSHLGSFTIQQARTMDRHLSHSFQIPPATMSIFSVITVLLGLPLYERVSFPFIRRFTRNPVGVTCLQRMGIGFTINIFATIVSALVEIKRKSVATRYNLLDKPTDVIPISVFWLIPQYCIYFISRTLHGPEVRYTDAEKLVLALVHPVRNLKPYFQAHKVIIVTDQPLRQILAKPEASGRLTKWVVEMAEYSIEFKPRTAIKAQALVDFLAEGLTVKEPTQVNEGWTLYVDGASSQ